MKQTRTIFLYSKSKPLEIKSKLVDLYLQGKPTLMNNPNGTDIWTKEIIKQLNPNNLKIEVPLRVNLKNTSGLFSLILNTGKEFIIATDIIRSFPLFYGYHRNKLFITDQIEDFQIENGRLEIDNYKLEEFCNSGLVFGNRTLYKNVYGVQSGEIVTIQNDKIRSERYYEFKPAEKPFRFKQLTEFTTAFDKLFLFVFSRMLKQNPNVNQWIIPLSGGHDSRLVVNYLYRLGVKNVICFSYGTPDNEQSRISKQVSEAVGYKWHFVEYTEQKWKALHDNGLFSDYLYYSSNGVSTPHLQDFLAIYELKTKGVLGDGDIILPGHTTIRETVFNRNTLKLRTREEALQYVYLQNVKSIPISHQINPIYFALQKMYSESKASPTNFMALCDWQERRAKFITNSIKTYEFLGFESYQPMWDREMADFWMQIPAEKRIDREPLYLTEKKGGLIKELIKIPYAGENNKNLRQSFSGIVKKIIPDIIIVKLLRIIKSKVTLNEGLNLIFAHKAKSVKEILDPIEDFPKQILPYFQEYLHRLPYQMDSNLLTTLYTIRILLDRNKK